MNGCSSYKKLSRRSFLKGVGGFAALSCFRPSFLLAESLADGTGKNILLINLAGGCDGLMMYPYYEGPAASILRSIRPTIYPALNQILPVFPQTGIPSKLGLHPAFAPLQNTISSSGAIVQKYGILADPGRSHDLSSQLMDLGVGTPSPANKGFMARFADRQNFQLFQYWGFSESAGYFAFNTEKAVPLVVDSLNDFSLKDIWQAWGDYDQQFIAETKAALLDLETPADGLQDRLKKSNTTVQNAVMTVRNDISTQVVGQNSAGDYTETSLGSGLRDSAKVLKAKMTRSSMGGADKMSAFYLTQGGYDHHSSIIDPNNGGNFPSLAGELAHDLAVFIEDLKAMGVWSKTAIVLFSEFGRTNHQNGTAGAVEVGTDHGWGSTTLLLSGAARAGVYGDIPNTQELNDPDVDALVPTTDYRDIFSEIFSWLGVPPKEIFDEPGYNPNSLSLFLG